ncbi:MFS transporter [Thiohalorhabdus denitrificans]|uniref:Sugar phosphate permease n=1 Tax=Thiohalorhabdus denitrificans TaxID=381306 RepID=A0A0P9GI47_9GAMM|nr:MFS transporter [Thiohalorhabdus denitrificans]KPV39656.1 MFS transporter [Thiohalorhabdus denitrificans]SCX95151.1 Sugar phosphate permease [Thiohalorhabdus denitrificans]
MADVPEGKGHAAYTHGIRPNLGQFLFQMLQVFFVGLTIGLQRNVVPALAEEEFGLAPGSYLLFMAFIISFGFVKGALNFVAGRLSERVGRRRVLLWGWLAALPIPFLILYAPSWDWIVAANVLLGVNQGFAWSMTVTSKADITRAEQRGLATGFNEFAGYTGVAIAGVVTGYLAADMDPRWALFLFGLTVALVALATAWLFAAETLHWARAEAHAHASGTHKGPRPRFPENVSDHPGTREIFTLVSFRHRTFAALSQAGSVEKFVDALVWAFFPAWLHAQGLTVVAIGWVVGVFGVVWGASQLWTGPLSDRIGRKGPIVAGMWICGAGVAATLLVEGFWLWCATAAVAGVGMALLYPTLIAAVSDISHPNWRSSSLGVYRFWRDTGYGLGGLAIGLAADATGALETGFWLTAIAMGLSGLWVLLAAEETHPRLNPAPQLRPAVEE